MASSNRVAVLRGGRKVADLADRRLRPAQAGRIDGRSRDRRNGASGAPGHAGRKPFLSLKASAGHGRDALLDVDLDLKSGEILGIAGVSGNGQTSCLPA